VAKLKVRVLSWREGWISWRDGISRSFLIEFEENSQNLDDTKNFRKFSF
jgi:hypothetical protein